MADNVSISAGVGTSIATDDVSGIHYQRVKLVNGALDAADPIPGDSTNGLDVDVTRIQAGENHLGEVGGRTRVISATLTRPADTNAYAAGDAVTDSTSSPSQITFSNAARINNGSGVIVSATLIDSVNAGTKGQFELWLFDASVTPNNDNAAFAPSDADAAKAIGVITFGANSPGSNNAIYPAGPLSIAFQCSGGIANIFGLLVVRNAYTPTSGEQFTIRLGIIQD
jgi:hypothetical protein